MSHDLSTVITGFLLTLARVSGLAVFFSWPGARQTPALAKAAFALLLTLMLAPAWPGVSAKAVSAKAVSAKGESTGGEFTGAVLATWLSQEVALGVTMGLVFLLVSDGFAIAGQLLGLQAGFSYASSVDPASQADTTVIPVLMQLLTGLLFFALGIDRLVAGQLAASLASCPPGACLPAESLPAIAKLAGIALSTGVKLALPLIALMVTTDLVLALLGRFCPQFQLLSAAFPLKIALSLFFLALIVQSLPPAYEFLARQGLDLMAHVLRLR